MQSFLSRLGSIFNEKRISPLESDRERPRSPGGSSIISKLSKKKRFPTFKLKGKRSLPVGNDSTNTLPSVPQSTEGTATPIGAETAFEIILSMRKPQPAQGENDGVQKSMERGEGSDESVAVVHPAAAQAATIIAVHGPEPAKDDTLVHGDALRRMGQGDHRDADDEVVQSSSLGQSAILSGLDSIAYAGGARRLSLRTTPPTTAEGDVFGIKTEAPKSPVEALRLVVGFLVPLMCWSIFFLFLDPAVTGSFAQYHQASVFGDPNHSKDGHWWYTIFENANLVAERRANAMLYGSSICVTAAVVTTVLLKMHFPPSRAARSIAILCAGTSLVASGVAVVRLWRLSSSTHRFGTASSFFSELLPTLAGDGEPIGVPDPHSTFTLKSSPPSPIATSCTSAPPCQTLSRWIF